MYFKTLKLYNKKRKAEFRKFKQNTITQLEDMRISDPQAYWKLLQKMKDVKKNPCEEFSLKEWEMYFKDLNNPGRNNNSDVESKLLEEVEKEVYFNELDFKITEKEVTGCIKKLKTKKAVGLDIISNEMKKYSQHVMLPLLIKMFNNPVF